MKLCLLKNRMKSNFQIRKKYFSFLSPLSNNPSLSSFNLVLSEKALMKARTKVEIEWLKLLVSYLYPQTLLCTKNPSKINSDQIINQLDGIIINFNDSSAEKIKEYEKTTNHDVKAVEYYIKSNFEKYNIPKELKEFTHLCCTSEDINNLSWSLILKEAVESIYLPQLSDLILQLANITINNSDSYMISRTHGQPATPTSFGKEMGNFTYRINELVYKIRNIKLKGKFNGAVGNFNAHIVVNKDFNWEKLSKIFIEKLGFEYNPYTTQIENHDSLCELISYISLLNTVIIDLTRDLISYSNKDYINKSKTLSICESNLKLSNSLNSYFTNKLPISRLQRDLSDSTTLRNISVSLSHSFLTSIKITEYLKGIVVNKELMFNELKSHWELLAEPLQSVMRYYGIENSYELLKKHTRGKEFSKEEYLKLVSTLENKLPEDVIENLKRLTPEEYVGNSKEKSLTIKKYLK